MHDLGVRISLLVLCISYVATRGHRLTHLNATTTAQIFTLLLLCLLINFDELKMIEYEIASVVWLLKIGKVTCSAIIVRCLLNKLS